ncbi:MAG: cytochrome c [Candidatus Hydrogenedentes bacterium]|nr:cytochrome c [Candidatus Hydrogenedentota bacterium]
MSKLMHIGAASILLLSTPIAASDIDYGATIAPIITQKCAACHYRDGAGPFPLLRYEDVVSRAAMIKEVVAERRMPPWHADPDVGHFRNDRRLTVEEIRVIAAWIDAGAPRGATAAPVELQRFPSQWRIGKPDALFTLPETVSIPATGLVPVKEYEVPSGFARDTWINAIEIRPGNTKVVHHVVLTLKSDAHQNAFTPESPLVARYSPATGPTLLAPGQGMLIPRNATFVVRVHYMSCGKPETDRTRFGFSIAGEAPAHPVRWATLSDANFLIPPNTSRFRVGAQGTVPADMLVHALNASMNYRGQAIELVAHYPSGQSESLLRISHFDFDWLSDYVLEKPLLLPRDTRIEAIGYFDNSSGNSANPNPLVSVRAGQGATDEIFQGGLLYSWIIDAANGRELNTE